MNLFEEFLHSVNDVKLGFVVAMVVGYSFYRLSRKLTTMTPTEPELIVTGDNDSDEYKMVFVIRNDLKMGKGKVAAQCAHAAVANYRAAQKHLKILAAWEDSGQKKITVKVDSEKELDDIAKHARSVGLITRVIHDAGRTQIASGSKTVCGIGPGPEELVSQVTGHLKLY